MTGNSKKPGRGVDQKGRSKKGGKFVALGNGLLTSEAWRSLGGPAVKYYIELRRQYNGINNGEIHLSCAKAAKLLHIGMATAKRAREELETKGLIRMTNKGGFHQRLATTWRLTDEPTANQAATHDYRNWQPEKKPSLPQRNDIVTPAERRGCNGAAIVTRAER